jgi:hypothetical protein
MRFGISTPATQLGFLQFGYSWAQSAQSNWASNLLIQTLNLGKIPYKSRLETSASS